jgi:formimidoylglutamate deiminase
MSVVRVRAEHLYTGATWLSPAFVEIGADGFVAAVYETLPAAWNGAAIDRVAGYLVPGLPNVHSHAHQRALAGRTERVSADGSGGSLWTWREQMYACVARLDPDSFEAIAEQAYVEMLKAGFTTVGEFHYVHHDQAGVRYANPAELSERVLAAAEVGIALTLLPVFYAAGGVNREPLDEQRRFVHADPDEYLALVERLAAFQRDTVRVGIAPHSVRAVDAERLSALMAAVGSRAVPIHIHVCERREEVEESIASLHRSPVDWLQETVGIDGRWTLVHATHCSDGERASIAAAGATVALCPATEANLGDGIFPLRDYVGAGGRWAVGTDMNHAINAVDELRTLELGQRLVHERRAILCRAGDERTSRPGRVLFDQALHNGAAALAHETGLATAGYRADFVVLDPEHPSLAGHSPETVLDAWIFSSTSNPVRDVMVAGKWVVRDGHHPREDEVLDRFRRALATVFA